MKALADYVHSKGLKLGIYSTPGPDTCAGYEGSYGHEEQDARTYAAWGIDYLKYDLCGLRDMMKDAGSPEAAHKIMVDAYIKMRDALLKTGRPIVTDVFKGALEGKNVTVWPAISGVTNWQHASFSPRTGLLYINTLHVGMTYEAPEPPKLAPGSPAGTPTVKRTVVLDDPNIRGYLKAVDPMTGKSKWETPYKSPNYSSTMVTASDLVFTGVMTGELQALDAENGKVLWSFQTPSGIVGQPITWQKDGKQYVTVISGLGGVYAERSGDPNLSNVPYGVSLWTFALFDK